MELEIDRYVLVEPGLAFLDAIHLVLDVVEHFHLAHLLLLNATDQVGVDQLRAPVILGWKRDGLCIDVLVYWEVL